MTSLDGIPKNRLIVYGEVEAGRCLPRPRPQSVAGALPSDPTQTPTGTRTGCCVRSSGECALRGPP